MKASKSLLLSSLADCCKKSQYLLFLETSMARSDTLLPRKVPTQPRAHATVEAILDATAKLLVEVGVDRLTTNAIAELSGINVASLYSYFPNKFAVLAALWDRMQERQRGLLAGVDATESPARAVAMGVDATFEFVIGEPGFVELADAVRLVPELRELSQQGHAAAAKLLRELLVQRRVRQRSATDVDAIAAVIVEVVSATLAHARRAPPRRRKRIVGELKAMLTAYLASLEGSR
jgi:AcrR family transcriptional regulator